MNLADLVPAMTIHPANQIGLGSSKGTLEPGKDADLILVDREFQVCMTFVRDALVYDGDHR